MLYLKYRVSVIKGAENEQNRKEFHFLDASKSSCSVHIVPIREFGVMNRAQLDRRENIFIGIMLGLLIGWMCLAGYQVAKGQDHVEMHRIKIERVA